MECLKFVVESLAKAHSQFHTVVILEKELSEKGYQQLKESETWNLEVGGNYYVKRNDSSILAFRLPEKTDRLCFHITASHSDSPTFKVKPNPITHYGNLMMLQTEPYGGGIYHTWMDRALSLAGRIIYADETGIHSLLVDIDEDLLDIPSLCIHFNRNVNEGVPFNPAVDMIPVLGKFKEDFDFEAYLSDKAGLQEGESLLSYDLFLYVREKPRFVGCQHEFLLSPREDDLSSAFSSFCGFIDSKNNSTVPLFCCFDNEEVGSLTRQGARSTFLKDVFTRICRFYGMSVEEVASRSFLMSIDNGHANHPNYPSYSPAGQMVKLNEGIMIKYNANQSYTTDGLSSSLIRCLAARPGLKIQEFTNRSDLRGGSTLGNLSNGEISFLSADMGLPQLAMHSCNELIGAFDVEDMGALVKEFYSLDFSVSCGDILFK